MIKEIEIKGFESHTNTKLQLHKGVNVVIGVSDSGKSSIIRSEVLLNENRPSGEEYKNDFLTKKDTVRVTNTFIDGSKVSIERKNNKTQYKINDEKEALRALNSNIPEEVQNITRIKNINIQGQHPTEQYFLLTESPGKVAKKFNEVVGLSIMDRAMTLTNSKKKEVTAELKVIAEEIKETKENLKDTKWIEKALEKAEKLQKRQSKILNFVEKKNTLSKLINNIVVIDGKLKKYININKAIEETQQLIENKKEVFNLKDRKDNIVTISNHLDSINSKLVKGKGVDNALNNINKLIKQKKEIKENTLKIKEINQNIAKLEQKNNEIISIKKELSKIEKEFNLIKKTEICPVCGRKG